MEGVTDKVRKIIKKLEISSPPIPLEKVANLFSIKIIYYNAFPDHISGMIVDQKEFIAIGINKNHPKVRQRFTIAHELGHFLLGHEIPEKIIDDSFDKPIDKEKEANKFASELLMPKDFLEKDLAKGNEILKIPDLARRYMVSEQAMSIKLMNSGLINKI